MVIKIQIFWPILGSLDPTGKNRKKLTDQTVKTY